MKFSDKYKAVGKYCESDQCDYFTYGIQDADNHCEKYNNRCFNSVEKCEIIKKIMLNKKLKKINEK